MGSTSNRLGQKEVPVSQPSFEGQKPPKEN